MMTPRQHVPSALHRRQHPHLHCVMFPTPSPAAVTISPPGVVRSAPSHGQCRHQRVQYSHSCGVDSCLKRVPSLSPVCQYRAFRVCSAWLHLVHGSWPIRPVSTRLDCGRKGGYVRCPCCALFADPFRMRVPSHPRRRLQCDKIANDSDLNSVSEASSFRTQVLVWVGHIIPTPTFQHKLILHILQSIKHITLRDLRPTDIVELSSPIRVAIMELIAHDSLWILQYPGLAFSLCGC